MPPIGRGEVPLISARRERKFRPQGWEEEKGEKAPFFLCHSEGSKVRLGRTRNREITYALEKEGMLFEYQEGDQSRVLLVTGKRKKKDRSIVHYSLRGGQ